MATTSDHPAPPNGTADGGGGDGGGDGYADGGRDGTRARGPRPGAALAVLGIAVAIVLGGVFASALLSGGTPVVTLRTVTISDGTTVPLTPGPTSLHSIIAQGQPPGDILGNLAVPTAARHTGTVNNTGESETYDVTATFTSGLSQSQVVDVYRKALPKLGWQVLYDGPARSSSGAELLAKHGSGDGYYWEVGLVVSPTTSAGTTPFSLELFQLASEED